MKRLVSMVLLLAVLLVIMVGVAWALHEDHPTDVSLLKGAHVVVLNYQVTH